MQVLCFTRAAVGGCLRDVVSSHRGMKAHLLPGESKLVLKEEDRQPVFYRG